MDFKDIKEIREALNCKQEELAQMLGISKTSLARYEMQNAPNPQGDVLKKLEYLKENLVGEKNFKQVFIAGGTAAVAGLLAMRVAMKGASQSIPLGTLCKILLPAVGGLVSTHAITKFLASRNDS